MTDTMPVVSRWQRLRQDRQSKCDDYQPQDGEARFGLCCMQVRAKAVELGELEERYWHDFNDFQIQLRAHVDERDVLLRKVRGVLLRP